MPTDPWSELAAKVAQLRDPQAYPGPPPAPVVAIETHMSWVFLAGDRAYKLKKPIRHGRGDFTTLPLRHAACLDEVRLNRRLAADVYLGVAPLRARADGALRVAGDEGRVVDWLIVMRRLAPELMLDHRLAAGGPSAAQLDQVALLLARFHRSLPPEPLPPGRHRERLEAAIRDDEASLLRPHYRLPAPLVQGLARAQLSFTAEHRALLEARVRSGRVVEGHGDLRPEHVCLEPQPVIIDCLEFDRELRVADAVADVAFLALECRRLGAAWAGERLLATYARAAEDEAPPQLVRFYQARHALTRAKVAAWHLDDSLLDDTRRYLERARHYLALAGELGRS